MKRSITHVPVMVSPEGQKWIREMGFGPQTSQLYDLIAEHFPGTAEIRVSISREPIEGSIDRLVVELVTELDHKAFRAANHQLFDALYQFDESYPQYVTLTRA